MAQAGGAATDLCASPNKGLVHQLRQNPYALGLASVSALEALRCLHTYMINPRMRLPG
jgi:hypothetical protein